MSQQSILISAVLVMLPAAAAAQTAGNAFFSNTVNWSQTPALYYSVAGGPPNTCGALASTRNGVPLRANGWLCTDANGNAIKGPWTWANTPGDQTDVDLRIEWPNGTSTVWRDHVWDKTCPTYRFTSPGGSPPAAWYGDASDSKWGAGFNSDWTFVFAIFEDTTLSTPFGNRKVWKPGLSGYTLSGDYFLPKLFVFSSLTGIPGHHLTWSNPQVPPPSAHVPGHTYRWYICVTDGDDLCGSLSCPYYEFVY
jgi:hypothetical protein